MSGTLNPFKFIGDLADNVADCFRSDADMQKRARYEWLHKAAVAVGVAAGVLGAYEGVENFGLTPAGLLSGPIVGVLVYLAVDALACSLEGKMVLYCTLAHLSGLTDALAKGLLGDLSPTWLTGTAEKYESKFLHALGCKQKSDYE